MASAAPALALAAAGAGTGDGRASGEGSRPQAGSSAAALPTCVGVNVDITNLTRMMYTFSFGPVLLFSVFEQIKRLLDDGTAVAVLGAGRANASCVADRAAVAAEAAYYTLFIVVLMYNISNREARQPDSVEPRGGLAHAAELGGYRALRHCMLAVHMVLYVYQRCNLAVQPECGAAGAVGGSAWQHGHDECSDMPIGLIRQVFLVLWLIMSAVVVDARLPGYISVIGLYVLYSVVSVGALLASDVYVQQGGSFFATNLVVDTVNLGLLNALAYYHFSHRMPFVMFLTSQRDVNARYVVKDTELYKTIA
jgi:hypothetical protein